MIEIPGFVKIPRIRRGQFSPKEEVDIKCRLVYDKLYFHANFTPNKKSGLLKGQVVMTYDDLAKSCYWLTIQNVRTCLSRLIKLGLIKKEKASKYCEDGHKITIIDYGDIKLSTACGTNRRLTGGVTGGVTGGSSDLTHSNDSELPMSEHTSQQAVQQAVQQATNNPLHNYVTKNLNTVGDDTASPAQTKPKKPRSPAKPKEHTSAHKVWLAYAESYRTRYGDTPYRPRNAYMVINTMLEQVIEEELTKRVKVYVEKLNDPKLVEAKHPLSWLDNRMAEVIGAITAQQPMKIRSF